MHQEPFKLQTYPLPQCSRFHRNDIVTGTNYIIVSYVSIPGCHSYQWLLIFEKSFSKVIYFSEFGQLKLQTLSRSNIFQQICRLIFVCGILYIHIKIHLPDGSSGSKVISKVINSQSAEKTALIQNESNVLHHLNDTNLRFYYGRADIMWIGKRTENVPP